MSVPSAPSVAPAEVSPRPRRDSVGPGRQSGPAWWRDGWDPWLLAVTALCAAGVAFRVIVAHQSLFADELSTYWIVARHGLGDVMNLLYSRGRIQHAEITPPLIFLADWVAAQISHAPEVLRAPSLIAGVLTLPALYALGRRTVGRPAALLAVAVTALSPFMIYYSAEARSYGLMMVLVVCSTLSMLLAVDTGRRRWWCAYALAAAGAFLTHYTCAFLLVAQFAWVVWVHPEARRPAILASAGAVILLIPWAPGLIEDFRSPTTQILSALSPFTLHDIRLSLEHWAIGFPYVVAGGLRDLPGSPALVMLGLVALLCAGGLLGRASSGHAWFGRAPLGRAPGGRAPLGRARGEAAGATRHLLAASRLLALARTRVGLIALLALSLPVGEAAVSAVSTHIFGVRNLAASWPALALISSAAVVALRPRLRAVAIALTLVAFAFGAARMLSARFQRPDFHAVAAYIEGRAQPRDVVLDGTGELSPGPLTGLDLTLDAPVRVVRFGAPQERDHPFNLLDEIPPIATSVRRAFALAGDARVFLVRYTKPLGVGIPAGYERIAQRDFPSLTGLTVEVYGRRPAAR